MVERSILHVDQNCFFASVEMKSHPEWRSVPMAVGGDSEQRHGIILAKNQLAQGYGVKTAEAIWQARQKCPDLLVVPAHFDQYVYYSERIREMFLQYTDMVEPFGLDECWLDVTGSSMGTPKEIADEIRMRVKDELGLSCSVGVSFNKSFAKLGSDYKKPDATTVITKENFREIVCREGDESGAGKDECTYYRGSGSAFAGVCGIGAREKRPLPLAKCEWPG